MSESTVPPADARRLRAAVAAEREVCASLDGFLRRAGLDTELRPLADIGGDLDPAAVDAVIVLGDVATADATRARAGAIPVLGVGPDERSWTRLAARLARLTKLASAAPVGGREREANRATAVVAAGRALMGARGGAEVARTITALGVEALGADACALYEPGAAGSSWKRVALRTAAPHHESTLPAELDRAALAPQSDQRSLALVARDARLGAGNVVCIALRRGDDEQALLVLAWQSSGAVDQGTLRAAHRIARIGALSLAHAGVVDELDAANRLKSEFVATVSHELRTPLNAILGFADLLLDGEFGVLGDEQSQVLRRAETSASALLELINSTLEAMRFDVDEERFEPVEVNYAELVDEVVLDVAAARQRQPVRVIRRDVSNIRLHSDPACLKLLLKQLLHAAIATGNSRAVEIRANPTNQALVIEVGDPAVLEAERGAPVVLDASLARTQRGGPSLYTIRRLAELVAGSITLWSIDERRLVFRLTLPTAPPEASRPRAAR